MKKYYFETLCWPLLALLASLTVMTHLWTEIGPTTVSWGLPLSASVSLLVAKTFLWLGRWVEGRPALLASAFVWGASVAALCSIWSQEISLAFLEARASTEFAEWFRPQVIVPVTSALSNGLFLLWVLKYRRSQVRGLLDGIIYGGLIGAGFAFVEQISYFGLMAIRYVANDATDALGFKLATGFMLRGVMVPIVHPVLVACIGLGVAAAAGVDSRLRQTAAMSIGFFVSIILYGIWHWPALSGDDNLVAYKIFAVMFPLCIGMATTALILRHR